MEECSNKMGIDLQESVTQRELSELDEFLVGRREETNSVLGKMSDMLDDYTRFIEDLASRRPQQGNSVL